MGNVLVPNNLDVYLKFRHRYWLYFRFGTSSLFNFLLGHPTALEVCLSFSPESTISIPYGLTSFLRSLQFI
ncbi:hypothetical protein ACN38_g11439 [Penicillium nordicum]|uniref:Uncharacterized protein n=1 Tax=Penicillium nordicum TaxID=229535 RepID=A0A0M8NYU0_9EURO|nr:hypothetical protein ACN38_g11439 [Penicillium nordicum]